MKLVVLLVFSILRHNDVITVLYWKYDFRFESQKRSSNLVPRLSRWNTVTNLNKRPA